MSDIRVDFDVLDHVRSNLRHIGELMERPGREMDEVDGESMGVAMHSMSPSWTSGHASPNHVTISSG